MSYDVSLFFPDAVFPLQQWKEAIDGFNPQEHAVRPSDSNRNVLAEWAMSHQGGSLWLELSDVRATHYLKPASAQWQVFLSHGGHRPHDVWLQFAVSYHALVLMKDVIFYDLQHDIYCEDGHQLLEFAAPRLHPFGLSRMFKLGLLDAHGNPLF